MITLSTLSNCCNPRRDIKRVGRGPGSGKGKTCGRGEKGAGSRSGYKRRWGYEGGQMRLHMKTPKRGFSNVRFRKELETINLYQIDDVFEDGDLVNEQSLRDNGLISGPIHGIKLLGDGELTKKVKIEVTAVSASAREKLQQAKIAFTTVE
jgi:large subunit ribosomal protein L15